MTLPIESAGVKDEYSQRAFDFIAQRFPLSPADILGSSPTTTATLPTGTYNGQDFYYQLTTGVWHFKYNSTSTKWDFSGGPSLFAEVTTAETTSSATYAALATAGPSVALPFIGDYDVTIGCQAQNTTINITNTMSYDIGGTGAVDADGVTTDTAVANDGSSIARMRRKTGLTAVTLTAKYKATGGTARFAARWISVTPVRVG